MENNYQSNDERTNSVSPFVTPSGLCYLGEFISCCGYVISNEKYVSFDDFWEEYQAFCIEKKHDICGERDFMRMCDELRIFIWLDPISCDLRTYITKEGTAFSPEELNDCLEDQIGIKNEMSSYLSYQETKKKNMKTELSESLLLELVCQFTKMWIQYRFLLYDKPITLDHIWGKYEEYCSEHGYRICRKSEFDIVLNNCGLDWNLDIESGACIICELY